MGTLFLIGNGFDVNCGMKTRYVDVYEGYIKEKATTDILKNFKETISSDIDNWGDFEMAMARYAECLESEDELLECVRDFAQYMEWHLLKEQNSFKKILNNKQVLNAVIKEVGSSLSSFYFGISHNVDVAMENRIATRLSSLQAVSFNYTDIFDTLLNEYMARVFPNQKGVIHVHGVLLDDPVFGVDNVEQIKAKYSLSAKGKRGFIKPFFNEKYDRQRVQQVKALIADADTICTYGMSLGESDLSWRNALVEWLRENEGNHLFVYQYSLSTAEYRTASEKMDIEDSEKERLLSKWGIESTDSIFEQIHIPCGKNIFNIQKIIEAIESESHEKHERELEKIIEKGKEFIEKHSQETATG